MSVKCFETCGVLRSWLDDTATGDSRSDCNFPDDIGAIMNMAARSASLSDLGAEFVQVQSETGRKENNRLIKGYIGSLFDECSIRNLDGFTVLVASLQAGRGPEGCEAHCPFRNLPSVSEEKPRLL